MVLHTLSNAVFDVEERYVPQRVIGTGAYGVVCAARDTVTSQEVAIKKITHAFDITTISVRTLREIKLLKHFHGHENVISITTILQPPPPPMPFTDIYVVMELLETDLHRIVHSAQALTEEHVRYFLYQLLRGLKFIHSANVLHRDLKPSNLLINSSCDLKICDFGMARAMSTRPEEHRGFMTAYVATRWYRAPEVMLSFLSYTQSIDMWSVGCIFAEMLGRKYLFPGTHYVHQLNLILQVLGTPPDSFIASVGSDRAQSYIRSLPVTAPIPLQQLFPNASSPALSLLADLLHFDPAARCTAAQALTHPFLARYHNLADEPETLPFAFDFEESALTLDQLRTRITAEIAEYRRQTWRIGGGLSFASSSAAASTPAASTLAVAKAASTTTATATATAAPPPPPPPPPPPSQDQARRKRAAPEAAAGEISDSAGDSAAKRPRRAAAQTSKTSERAAERIKQATDLETTGAMTAAAAAAAALDLPDLPLVLSAPSEIVDKLLSEPDWEAQFAEFDEFLAKELESGAPNVFGP